MLVRSYKEISSIAAKRATACLSKRARAVAEVATGLNQRQRQLCTAPHLETGSVKIARSEYTRQPGLSHERMIAGEQQAARRSYQRVARGGEAVWY